MYLQSAVLSEAQSQVGVLDRLGGRAFEQVIDGGADDRMRAALTHFQTHFDVVLVRDVSNLREERERGDTRDERG